MKSNIITISLCDSCARPKINCPYHNGKRKIPPNGYPGGDGVVEVIDSKIVDCAGYI